MKTKICTKCGIEKNLGEFSKAQKTSKYYRSMCKSCRCRDELKYYLKNKVIIQQKQKRYRAIPKIKKHIQKQRNEYNKRPEIIEHLKKYRKEYYSREEIKEHIKKYKKNYTSILKNKKYRRIYINKWMKNKRKNDQSFVLLCSLRQRIRSAIKDQSGRKHTNTMSYVGCTLEQFKKHLELQFKGNINWSNYGVLWEIDHCIPCSYFDLTKLEQQKECFHYSNMKPMLSSHNNIKGNRYAEPRVFNTI